MSSVNILRTTSTKEINKLILKSLAKCFLIKMRSSFQFEDGKIT